MSASQEEIAEFTGMSLRTLERRLADPKHALGKAYAAGLEERTASLLRMMWVSARQGNVKMLIWLSKNLMGWKDRSEIDVREVARKLNDLPDDELVTTSRADGPGDEEPEEVH